MGDTRYPRRQPLGVPGPAEAGLTVLGRLLLVGLVAGAGVGALVGAVLAFPEPWTSEGVSWLVFFGAVAGLLAGVPTQVVTAALLRAGRGRAPQQLLVAAAPATVAGGSAWIVAAADWASTAHGVVAVVVAVAVATTAALATRQWCLSAPAGAHVPHESAAH